MISNKNKPVIEDVIISKEKMDELNSKLESSTINGGRIIRKILGGSCTYCAGIPTKKVAYDVGDDVKKIEWYCDKCFEIWIEKEKREF